VAIEESALLWASLLVYALPLLLLVLGAVAGQQWLPAQDAGAIAGALAGLVAGFGIARIRLRYQDEALVRSLKIRRLPAQ
jgi:sigma-E factor negative regulatory protein RseC